MINDKIDSILDNAKEGTSLGSWKVYNKQALLTLIEEVVNDVIGEDLPLEQPMDDGMDKVELQANRIFRKGANWMKENQRANFKKVMGK